MSHDIKVVHARDFHIARDRLAESCICCFSNKMKWMWCCQVKCETLENARNGVDTVGQAPFEDNSEKVRFFSTVSVHESQLHIILRA